MSNTKVYQIIASAVQARMNCAKYKCSSHDQWSERIAQVVRDFLPSGSGWDNGTKIDLDASHGSKIVLYGAFHHMDEGGMYDGWTDHTITATPAFEGIDLRISGRNRNDIKDYLHELFDSALEQQAHWDTDSNRYIPSL